MSCMAMLRSVQGCLRKPLTGQNKEQLTLGLHLKGARCAHNIVTCGHLVKGPSQIKIWDCNQQI